jgi:hypothetical protein
LLLAASMDRREQRKPDAGLRMVRLAEDPRSGPPLKVRIGKDELTAFLAVLNLPNALPVRTEAA